MILIIDDDSAVRSSLSFMLKRAGYEVKTAPGPREAMDIVRAEAPALILMDMNFTLSTTGEAVSYTHLAAGRATGLTTTFGAFSISTL